MVTAGSSLRAGRGGRPQHPAGGAINWRDENCRLAATDLLGADLRDANLRGADLSSAIFLTQPQLEQAIGDAHTVLPSQLDRPGHWT
ncbi:pentapeptide repeat-containing protein [Luteococcus sanguinis]|uniref:Pentapeptide repeat-containing protein n=1 Tax=Luteococcus sanguinis TaxID=174038 RepID=A0ABW1X326_9ACTN